MTSRQDKFDRERQEMLSQMGMDNEVIDVPAPEAPAAPMSAEKREAMREYEAQIQEETDAFIEKRWQETAQAVQNHKAAALRALGPIESFLFDWCISNGQAVFGVLFFLFVAPVTLYTLTTQNAGSAMVSMFLGAFLVAVFGVLLSKVIVPAILFMFQSLGPKYTIQFRYNHPIGSTVFGLLNVLMKLIGCGYPYLVLICGFIVVPVWFMPSGELFSSASFLLGSIATIFFVFAFALVYYLMCLFYEVVAQCFFGIFSHGEFRLNYLHDGAKMCSYRPVKKGMPSINLRWKAYQRRFGLA